MNFASLQFWTILALCFLGSRGILFAVSRLAPSSEAAVAKLCLLATALTLLAAESWLTLGAFLWVVGFGWIAVRSNDLRPPWRTPAFLLLLLIQLTPLFYYKYWNFVFNGVLGLDWRIPSVLIPMGLSFYTFQTVAFWIDSRQQHARVPTLLDYLNFCSFFPQIVAGPIERKDALLPQIEESRYRIDLRALDPALRWIVLGLAYKLIVADNLGNYMESLRVTAGNPWHVWLECIVFGLRIYFDFAGYSFIAVGLGLLFGVKLTLNFTSPYWSRSPREFWRRWHVSLGSWLRDYIYRPMGGSLNRPWLSLIVVFLVSGIWHGAGWGFLIWGLLHGAGVAVCRMTKLPGLPAWLGIPATFLFVTAAWLPFFERNTAMLQLKAGAMLNPYAYLSNQPDITGLYAQPAEFAGILLIMGVATMAIILERVRHRRDSAPYQLLRSTPVVMMSAAAIVLLASSGGSPFIYFNF